MGRSFTLLSYLPGERLFEKWFDDTWATEEKRLRILTQIAESMAELGKLRFKEVRGLLFDPSGDSFKIGPTYERRNKHAESSEVVSYGPWRTYHHYQRDREGQMSHEINYPGKFYRKLILMASRSIPDFMYGDGTYLAHPDFNLQNILVDDEGNVTGIIDWDDTWTRSRSTGYASFPMWLTQDWHPAGYAWNAWSDPSLDDLRPFQSRPDDLRRWRKHYSAVFVNKWTEHLETGICDTREHTNSHIMQTIDHALLCKASCPAIVVKLLDHAFKGDMLFDLEKFAQDGYDKPEEADVLAKIGRAFDEMWLYEQEF
jgi:hypothetical protein